LKNRYRPTPRTAVAVPSPEPDQAMMPEQFEQQGMSLVQIAAMVRARWKPIVIIAVTVTLLGAIAIKFLPKTYTATATLIADTDVKDPLAGRDFPVEMIANYVSTQIELMTSPIVLLPVVDRLKLTEDKNFTAGFGGSSDALALREFVEKNLASSLLIERGTGGQLIYVSASAKSAARAAEITNAVADVYIEQDRIRRNGPANDRAQRYSEELAELRNKATIAQDKVTAFRKEHDIDDLSREHGDSEDQALETLHQRLLETQNERRLLESKASGLRSAASASPASGSPQTLRAQLESQLAQLDQLKNTYGPQHPKMRELATQIAATRQSLGDQERALSGAQELERKYTAAVAEQEEKVRKLREAQDEGSKLLLELDSARSVYKQALDGFDQIKFQAGANHANVSIVSHAVAPLRASKPNKLKLMLLTLLAGIGVAVIAPLGYELLFDRRLRCRDDMEREFGVPVLAQLDAVPALAQR
jgi:succinoglycan biosynthesis transport protein ExoP